MTASPAAQLTDVTRTVTLTHDRAAVALEQTFPVHPEELWSALTIGSHLEAWFGRATGEVVQGGRFELPDMETRGEVLAVEEPRSLQLSWNQGGSRSEMELLVEPVEDASRFTLRHTVPTDAHWKTFGPAATGCGWDAALYALALHLEDPAADLIRRLGDFAGSAEGEEFTHATAEAWSEAHVAAGESRKPARKASLRTAAFYLGEEPELS
ncbi:SRPBCC domain-containing protein [Brachybacterium massiliense]|uniref:SRPBCC domain-containing protein n=1 Tax=Brachybacterium massiliense TaxID=1755098 RepID=A0A921MV13_9MICO|nr:SRPBCC domain-containing protein [Brachybacterium massiliense]HJG90912.1 SRPBCC domain-containing protein [Brachybacterium massiliense]